MSNLRSFVVTPSEVKHHTPSVFCTLCTKTFCTGVTSSIHLGSLDTKILSLELLQKFIFHPSVSLSFSIKLVAKVKIFIKLIMYVISHGCLLYKAFFHLHT